MHPRSLTLLLASSIALCACSRPEPPAAAPAASTTAPSAPAATTTWGGRWNGPEGTFLDVAGGPGTYRIMVQNLDGPRSFDAKAGSGTLVFTRDGAIETIRSGSGVDTGMKWLADKRDCLVVRAGEGYCRD